MTWLDDLAVSEAPAVFTPPLVLRDPYNYGQDFSCNDDLTPNADEIAGIDVLSQDLLHRGITPRGSLVDDPNYGRDAREDIGASLTQTELLALPGKYSAELSQDDRVDHVDVTVNSLTQEQVALTCEVIPLVGPAFRFTASIANAYAAVTSVGSP